MSAESHADQDEQSHDDEHDEDALDSDEPRTPGWVSLLGCALFLLAGIYVIATDDGPQNLVKPEQPAQAQAEVEPAEPPPATAQVAHPTPPAAPGQVDPQQARAAAQRLIDQLKLRGAPGGPGGPKPGGGRGDGSGRGRGDGSGRGQGHGPGDGHGH